MFQNMTVTVDQEIGLSDNFVHSVHGTVKGDVVLFRATAGGDDAADEPVVEVHSDPLLGWERRVTGKLLPVDVPGGHVSMLQEPHVQALASALQARIDDALAAVESIRSLGRISPVAGNGAMAVQGDRVPLEASTADHLG